VNNPKTPPEPAPKDPEKTVIPAEPAARDEQFVGPYKLLELIGEGSHGVVYMAEQTAPVRRVALKVIQPGMDTALIIARFESERQALALMNHPNIASVFDAGATDSGRPYFVMELVTGLPITAFCDKNHLSLDDRLKLFIDVCHAIQHAHHKGIFHRDIKPSNVLVTFHDGPPVVKVIDFGVAKATVQKLTESPLLTARGQMVGTPIYMSPEQAETSRLDIDTRSDVYSLGVLLYELLTGTTPLQPERLQELSPAQIQRFICEDEPPRPSNRLFSLGAAASVAARNRGLDVKALVHLLSVDLDWMVMKALEKDRNRRYDTPASFAEDVARYLQQEPVVARPPSKAYRLRKFIKRNRGAVLTLGAVLVALLVGTVVSAWLALWATRAEHAAVASANSEREAKDAALAREAESKAMLGFLADRILAAARPEGQAGGLGRDVTLRDAIETAVHYVDQSFPEQPLVEANLRLTLGQSYFFLGQFPKAVKQQEAARELYARNLGWEHRDTLVATSDLAKSYEAVGRLDDAVKLSERARALLTARLGPYHRDTLASSVVLASAYAAVGRLDESLKLHEETLTLQKEQLGLDDPDTLTSQVAVALRYYALGRHSECIKLNEETLALQRHRLGPTHPATLATMNNLANDYIVAGRFAEALKLHKDTFALAETKLGPDHPDTLSIKQNLANSYEAVGRPEEAIKLREAVLRVQKDKLGPDHISTLHSMNNLASNYFSQGRTREARKLMEEALVLSEAKLGTTHPDTLSAMYSLSVCYRGLNLFDKSLELSDQTLRMRKTKLGLDHPETLLAMLGVAQDLFLLGRGAESVGIIDECFRRAAGRVVNPALLPALIETRLRHFEKIGDPTGCRQTAVIWENLKRRDAESLYIAANLRAITSAVVRAFDKSASAPKEADREADQAMQWLKQAIGAGYQDVDHIANDDNFDSLRNREDFKKLTLGAKRKASPSLLERIIGRAFGREPHRLIGGSGR
jgi:serine/threonine protein kinase